MMSGGTNRRPPVIDGDEQDVTTAWRHIYTWTRRAGATAVVKRRIRRRERRAARRSIEESANS